MITPPKATHAERDDFDIVAEQRLIDILTQLLDFARDPWCRGEIEAMIGEHARLIMTIEG